VSRRLPTKYAMIVKSFGRLTWYRQNRTFLLLSQDYTKSVHLQEDRRLELHGQGELHHFLRLPRYGRDLCYDRRSTEVLIPSVGLDKEGLGEVYRLSLERGTFLKSFQIEVGIDEGVENTGLQGSVDVGAVNTGIVAEGSHGLYAFGTTLGTLEFWDPRVKSRIATFQAFRGAEVTAMEYNPSGLGFAVGSSSGQFSLYDLRSPAALLTKDHGYGFPLKKLQYLSTPASSEVKILSCDKKALKIFDEKDGKLWASVHADGLNDVAWIKDTGMLLTANEGPHQNAFFIPQLGPAPKWCSFLERMVEEMQETPRETYDNYKFLTMPELKSLSLSHLVGKTNLLRPYMHGYFVASKLYDQARIIANPYDWEEEKAKRIQDKVEKERASRIRGTKKVKVNQKLVDKLLKKQERREKIDLEAGLLGDERFRDIFEDEDFKIDETSREFQALNPSTKVGSAHNQDGSEVSESSEDSLDSDGSADDPIPIRKPENAIVMRASSSKEQGSRSHDTVLGSRVQKSRVIKHRQGDMVGEKSVTFVPESNRKGTAEPAPTAPTKHRDNRRSASGNTFRKI